MKMLVSPVAKPERAQDSRVRTVVVPTATTRAPRWRQRSSAASVDGGSRYHSLCIRCCSRLSVLTGKKVPAPTCSVMLACSMPRAASALSTDWSKCSAAVVAAEQGLVALAVLGLVGVVARVLPAHDVGRQRQVAVALHQFPG